MQILALLAKLTRSFPPFQTDDPEMWTETFVEVLSELPLQAVENTINRVIRGQQPEHDGRFCPTVAQIAKWTHPEADRLCIFQEREKRFEQLKRDGLILDDPSQELPAEPIKRLPPAGSMTWDEVKAKKEAQQRVNAAQMAVMKTLTNLPLEVQEVLLRDGSVEAAIRAELEQTGAGKTSIVDAMKAQI